MVHCVYCTSPGDGQTLCKVWLASSERRRCSNKGKKRNPLKFTGVPQTPKPISAASGLSAPYCEDMCRRHCCLSFLIVNTCLSCKDTDCQSCAMVPRWQIFGNFLHLVFSARHVQHVSDLHSKYALRPHRVWKYGTHSICE